MKKFTLFAAMLVAMFATSVASAQDIGFVESMEVTGGTTFLTGYMATSTSGFQDVDIDFLDDQSVLYVDPNSGNFALIIESDSQLDDEIISGQSSSGSSFVLGVLDDPNAPKYPPNRNIVKHEDSTPITSTTEDGDYIYVMDEDDVIHILPVTRNHPEILGGNQPVTGAGELTVENGVVTEVTNRSGNFRFHGDSILLVIENLEFQGIDVDDDANTPIDLDDF